MPSVEVSAPVSSVASDRLALGVGWVRPGGSRIGGTLTIGNPSLVGALHVQYGCSGCVCFEGNEE